jgi:malate dehydrogenase (oxaloacetate-decarboxylating)(NADP+)
MTLKEDALEYHSRRPAGKLEITPTKPALTQRDLVLAYTPGVAEPCREIEKNPDDVFKYTARGNLVAVITNGTAVLGLGDIGPLAAKPVMEGKSLLFKRFADIDAIDLELDTHDVEALIAAVRLLEPTFGGINLEDIKAPECFEIEQRLRETMNIPVFHDDQHGTAIISGAALLNALELAGKRLADVRITISGAGASAVACARFYVLLGATLSNIMMVDSKGVIYKGRAAGMNPIKEQFAVETSARTLADALEGADVFIGLSAGGIVSGDMIRRMASNPIIFALANPDPEIPYDEARAVRPDAIVATGRSDYPNQVNNVLGFPFIFRGALDVRARRITEQMKIAAARALAALAREDVPDSVVAAYGLKSLRFGPDYLIPKPLDPRVLLWVAPAVAQAAIDSGVARLPLDREAYVTELEGRLGRSRELMRIIYRKARTHPRRLVLAEGEHEKIIRAAYEIANLRIARPILLGRESIIRARAEELRVSLDGCELIDPAASPDRDRYAQRLYELRCRKGVNQREAAELIKNPNYFAAIMTETGDADGMMSGMTFHIAHGLRAPLEIIRTDASSRTVAGVHLIATRNRVLFFADTTVNIEPEAPTLADIAGLTARLAREFGVSPRVAFLSFSNFGKVKHRRTEIVRQAVAMVAQRWPDLPADGEMQANTALVEALLRESYPFNRLGQPANVLIFPNLESANIAFKLVQQLASAEVIGPIVVGMKKPVFILQPSDEVKDIVNNAAIAVIEGDHNRQ